MSVVDISGVQYPIYAARFSGMEKMALDMSIALKDSNNAAIDLTGATFNFVLGSLTESSSGIVISGGGAMGIITLTATDAAMAVITAGVYQISLTYTIFGRTFPVFTGTYTARESYL